MANQKGQKLRKLHVPDSLNSRLLLVPRRFHRLACRWIDERGPGSWILRSDGLDHPLLLYFLLGHNRLLHHDLALNLARHVADQVPLAP